MTIDPRTPVLIGCGQVKQRVDDPLDAVEPLELMREAARLAERDTGAGGVLASADAIFVPKGLWPYANPAEWLRDELAAPGAATGLAPISGSMVQHMASLAALDVAAGRRDLVLLVGAEAEHSRRRAKARGIELPWRELPESSPDVEFGSGDRMASSHEFDRGIGRPPVFFSLYENAMRHARGESLDAHRERVARLWAGFSRVAADNPHAWTSDPLDPEAIRTPSDDNRLIAWPYTKRMCSNMVVDLGAAVILCAEEVADRLGVPRAKRVYLHAATDAAGSALLSHRMDFVSEPAMRIAGRRVLDLAGTNIEEVDHLDLYSCFPAAVQLAVRELGVPPGRALSVTGGLGFAGGPFNSYVLHSIATMMDRLRGRPGRRGLVTSIGGWVAKHAFGVYGSDPPARGLRYEDVSAEVAALPVRELREQMTGAATIETYALRYRDGAPEGATAACLDDAGVRAWAWTDDPVLLERMTREEPIGWLVRLDEAGRLTPA